MFNDLLLLFGSNATKSTFQILETLALPRLSYFRYRKRWVETLSLWDKLPIKGEQSQGILKSRKYSFLCISARNKQSTAVCSPNTLWSAKECYRTGRGDNDIAHFYFEAQSTVLIQI